MGFRPGAVLLALALVSHGAAVVAEQPRERPLDFPGVPSESLAGVDPGAGDARDDVALPQQVRCSAEQGALSERSLPPGRRLRGPRREHAAGTPGAKGLRAWMPWVFTAEAMRSSAMPPASQNACRLLPCPPRSVGFRPVSEPPVPPVPKPHPRWPTSSSTRLRRRGRPRPSDAAAATPPLPRPRRCSGDVPWPGRPRTSPAGAARRNPLVRTYTTAVNTASCGRAE